MTSRAVGLVLARPARLLKEEAFWMELLAGVEEELSERGLSVLLHVVRDHEAEIATWRRWDAERLVDAVVVADVNVDDVRLPVLSELGLPAVVMGGPPGGLPVPSLFVDDDAAARAVVEGLDALGHRNLARVTGPSGLWHTRHRDDAFVDECAQRGLVLRVLEGDYSESAGVRLTEALLRSDAPPTAVVYDNDAMAAAGLATAARLGRSVPSDLSIVAWDDSALCRLVHPALSVMAVDVFALGGQLARLLARVVDAAPGHRPAPAAELAQPHRLELRGSTGPAPLRVVRGAPHDGVPEAV